MGTDHAIRRCPVAVSWLSPLLLLSIAAGAQEPGRTDESPNYEQRDRLKPYAHIIGDLRERSRRVIHTEHPVSAQHGIVRGFVHVTDGSAALARTDLVVDAALPIIVRRAYHSARHASPEFGAGGWHLTAVERIEPRANGRLVYMYGNGMRLELARQGRIESKLQAYLSDVAEFRLLDREVHVLTRTGLSKVFRRSGDGYVLSSVSDTYGNQLQFQYSKQRLLKRIDSSSAAWVALKRDDQGRIVAVEDSHGRVVNYRYDSARRLAAVEDPSRQQWKYAYDSANRLTSTMTPNETVDVEFHYDRAGRVAVSRANAARFAFKYRGRATAVTDAQGLTTSYVAGASGLTVGVTNALGTRTSLQVSKSGLPVALLRNDQPVVTFSDIAAPEGLVQARMHARFVVTYDSQHRVIRAASADGSSGFTVENYGAGLMPQTTSFSDGTIEGLQFDARGDLAKLIKRDGAALSFERAERMWRIEDSAGRDAELLTDAFGRLIVAESGGQSIAFTYNDQGLRETTQSSEGWNIRYQYDASGNLYYAARGTATGASKRSHYLLGEDRRLEGIAESDGGSYQFHYDALGGTVRDSFRKQYHRSFRV